MKLVNNSSCCRKDQDEDLIIQASVYKMKKYTEAWDMVKIHQCEGGDKNYQILLCILKSE